MALFEGLLTLMVIAVLLMQASKHLKVPYPTILAFTGCLVGSLPWAPKVSLEPKLALALFVTPALFASAYRTNRRQLKQHWVPLTGLVIFAVLFTTAAVALLGYYSAGLPIAAAIALGAIVAPPDAAAVSTVLSHANLPKNTLVVLQGESLLNDALSLLIFATAVASVGQFDPLSVSNYLEIAFAVPGALFFGWIWARLFLRLVPFVAQSLSMTILEFVMTFGAWILADHFHVSPILSVVAFGFTVAKFKSSIQNARDRIHSESIWGTAVFILNVLAFLIMGLQSHVIMSRISASEQTSDLLFALSTIAVVFGIRFAWVAAYYYFAHRFEKQLSRISHVPAPSMKTSFLISWCGIRGLITLATAFALPLDFPRRDLVVLTAFAVVLSTLALQGLTIGPIIKWLGLDKENEGRLVGETRRKLLQIGLTRLKSHDSPIATALQEEFRFKAEAAACADGQRPDTEYNQLRREAIDSQRAKLADWRGRGTIDEDTFHELESELDWAEMGNAQSSSRELLST